MTATKTVPPMIVTDTGITIFINGSVLVAPNDHPNFQAVKDSIAQYDFDAIPALLDVRATVNRFVGSVNAPGFTMIGDFLALDGKPFTFDVTDKVLNMISEGQPAEPIYNFLRKVRNNPRVAAQDELLLFCVANNFMIHADGDIIAYKSVRADYKDIHSGTILNAVGSVVEMPRQSVNDDRNRTCSTGLHFASYEYASTWAGTIDGVNRRLVVMKINPADVVAIPSDYNNQKGRTWRYEIIAEITGQGGPLPKREVYTNADLCVTRTTDVRENNREIEIRRKNGVLSQWLERDAEIDNDRLPLRSELEDLQDRITQIESLGGNADELFLDAESLETEIEELENEQLQLAQRIWRIENEIRTLGGTPVTV
jgi:hypothetical protein